MSETLEISLDLDQPTDGWRQQFVEAVTIRYRASKLHSADLRLVVRMEQRHVLVEPFLGAASFLALIKAGKKISLVNEAIRTIVYEAFRYSDLVGILLRAESGDDGVNLCEVSIGLEEALDRLRKSKETWFRLQPPLRRFQILRVQAKLYNPLQVETRDVATHYFRNYEIAAEQLSQVKELLFRDLAMDGAALVSWDAVKVAEVPLWDSRGQARVLHRSGRVYFSDPSQ